MQLPSPPRPAPRAAVRPAPRYIDCEACGQDFDDQNIWHNDLLGGSACESCSTLIDRVYAMGFEHGHAASIEFLQGGLSSIQRLAPIESPHRVF